MKGLTKITGLALLALTVLVTVQPVAAQEQPQALAPGILPGAEIPKYVDPLPVGGDISVIDAAATPNYDIFMVEFPAQVLPSFWPAKFPKGVPKTKVWGYRTLDDLFDCNRKTYIGPLVVAKRGIPVKARYRNDLFYPFSDVQPLIPVDLTIQWANPLNIVCAVDPVTGQVSADNPPECTTLPSYNGPWPTAAHLHGGEVPPSADGGPDAWFTFDGRQGIGSKYNVLKGATLNYPNSQEASTIWFHDHSFGTTRHGVYAGMAGMYVITDPSKEPTGLPTGKYDIPLIIQDRSFDKAGQLFYNLAANEQPNPSIHPFWIPEFIGDAIVVNGKTWPYLNVEPRKYRFRVLNGSQARFYNLYFGDNRSFKVIATDGGYLPAPATQTSLLIGPGERYEIVVDFKGAGVGSEILLKNNANTPFPGGDPVDADTTAQIMKFKVVKGSGDTLVLQKPFRKQGFVDLTARGAIPANAIKRQLTLNEIALEDGAQVPGDPGGPLMLVLNNTEYNAKLPGFLGRDSEMPAVGDTEIWEIINISADAHPIHIHLVQFQVINRQAIRVSEADPPVGGPYYDIDYQAAFPPDAKPGEGPPNAYLRLNADGAIGGNPAVGPYLLDTTPTPPDAGEKGWKDTAIMYPGQVTRVAVRWAPVDTPVKAVSAGVNKYPFNPTELVNGKVGYVWHCHILEHEDNEMMRPYVVGTTRQQPIP